MNYYPLGVLTLSWVVWIWDTYLSFRQYNVYTTGKLPKELQSKISDETFRKSRDYAIEKARFTFIKRLFSQILTTVVLYHDLILYFWELSGHVMTSTFGLTNDHEDPIKWEIIQTWTFFSITLLTSFLVYLPFSIYKEFVVEARHGVRKETAGPYALGVFLAFTIGTIVAYPASSAFVRIARDGGKHLPLQVLILCFVLIYLFSIFRRDIGSAPARFTQLPKGDFREKIEKLANEVEFPLSDISVVVGQERSTHSYAYLSGWIYKESIVIHDTVIKAHQAKESCNGTGSNGIKTNGMGVNGLEASRPGCDQDEIVALLCHEFGHWHHGHLYKSLAFREANFLVLYLAYLHFFHNEAFYSSFGFHDGWPVVASYAFLMAIGTLLRLFRYLAMFRARYYDHQADDFAAKLGHAAHLKTALIKLYIDNLDFPIRDELYSKFASCYPTLMERLKNLSKQD